jgi:fumarate hydratase subunit beta
MEKILKITPPLKNEDLENITAGNIISITGTIYTARDAAHKRLIELLDAGKPLPIDLKGQILYYVGPSPAKPGKVIGSAGPTTAYRMDSFTERLLEAGLKAMIGKGNRGAGVKEALKKHKAVYFAAIGGAGAYLANRIKEAEIVAYEDLGPEAIRKLEVENFPCYVANDIFGNDIYEEAVKKYEIK